MSNIKAQLKLASGIEVAVEGESAEVLNMIRSLSQTPAPIAAKVDEHPMQYTKADNKRMRRNNSYSRWTEAEVMAAVQVAREKGIEGSHVALLMGRAVGKLGLANRTDRNLEVFGYRLSGYLRGGAGNLLSRPIMEILEKNDVRPGDFGSEGLLGNPNDYNRTQAPQEA